MIKRMRKRGKNSSGRCRTTCNASASTGRPGAGTSPSDPGNRKNGPQRPSTNISAAPTTAPSSNITTGLTPPPPCGCNAGKLVHLGVVRLGRLVSALDRTRATPQRTARRRPAGPQTVRLGRHDRAARHPPPRHRASRSAPAPTAETRRRPGWPPTRSWSSITKVSGLSLSSSDSLSAAVRADLQVAVTISEPPAADTLSYSPCRLPVPESEALCTPRAPKTGAF